MEIIITKELVSGARDYIPDAVKEAWTAENAPKCFDKLAITADGEAMPPMYAVNSSIKARYLMAAFAGLYLNAEYEAEKDNAALMTVAEYDRWAGSHVFNQMERLKRFDDVRDKIFDIIEDYRSLEKRFHAAVGNLLNVQNDPVIRQNEVTSNAVKELPTLLAQINALQEDKTKKEEAE